MAAVILGTWNLEVYASPHSRKGQHQVDVLLQHDADLWFLTELHADLSIPGHSINCAAPRPEASAAKRKAAISTRWPMEPVQARDDPVEGRLCMARIYEPTSGESILAVSTVLPWRGATPLWRGILGRNVSYPEVFTHVLDYVVDRVAQERRTGEAVIWGGDFNQGLSRRDYVGTLQGRATLLGAMETFGLQVPTRDLPAKIEAHPAIDHIAIPAAWRVVALPEPHTPERDGRPLSDHALYLVRAEST